MFLRVPSCPLWFHYRIFLRVLRVLWWKLSFFQNDAFPHSCGLRGRGPVDVIEKFEAEVVHARAEFADLLHVLVVGDHGRNCRKQTGGSGDQRLGNSRCDGTQGCSAGIAESLEGVDDAPHRTEKSYEWRDCAGGREPGKARFHL